MTNGTIIVGVDGSTPAQQALRWAGRQAEMTGASLVAVMAWEVPGAFGWADVPEFPAELDLQGPAARVLAEAVGDALPAAQAAAVEQVVVLGNPAQAILDHADGADLIVVGVRGHGTFQAALLGSVSHTVTLHATCPVVVVRGTTEVTG